MNASKVESENKLHEDFTKQTKLKHFRPNLFKSYSRHQAGRNVFKSFGGTYGISELSRDGKWYYKHWCVRQKLFS